MKPRESIGARSPDESGAGFEPAQWSGCWRSVCQEPVYRLIGPVSTFQKELTALAGAGWTLLPAAFRSGDDFECGDLVVLERSGPSALP